MLQKDNPPSVASEAPDSGSELMNSVDDASPLDDNNPQSSQITRKQIAGALIALISAALVTALIIYFAPQLKQLEKYGYPGIFLTSLIGNASIALPIPSLAITFAMGGVLNWVIVGLVSGIGEALGESTGYLAGLGGSFIIENQRIYKRMKYWMENHGMLTIFLFSVIPNPLIDLAGIAAGASRYKYYKFLLACWMGKTIKTLVFAWAGAHSVNWLMQFL